MTVNRSCRCVTALVRSPVMSWQTSWRLRTPPRFEQFEAAVRQAIMPESFEVELHVRGPYLMARVLLPRAFVERHSTLWDPLPDSDAFWGTLEVISMERHPLAEDSPYEPVVVPLADANNHPVGRVLSLCAFGHDMLAATKYRHTFLGASFGWGGGRWDELEWPDDHDDDSLPDCVGWDGVQAWAAGVAHIYKVRGYRLVPVATIEGEGKFLKFIGGVDGRTVAVSEEGIVWGCENALWSILDRDTLGWVQGFATGPSGIYVSAPLAPLARIDADRVVRLDRPEDELSETPLICVAGDGAVWHATSKGAVCFDGRAWTLTETGVDVPFAMLEQDGAPVLLGKDGICARWNGVAWEPFQIVVHGEFGCACVNPDGDLTLGGESEIVVLEPRGVWHELVVRSKIDANRELWDVMTTIAERVARLLGAGPAY